jgi:hypothetical protein
MAHVHEFVCKAIPAREAEKATPETFFDDY